MFKELIQLLQKNNKLQDTVIIGYGDHYAYGIKDDNILKKLSGDNRLEKTPLFIWSPSIKHTEVNKICSSIDLLPTIANLFNVGDKGNYLGRDIFDENYEGLAFFKDYSYLTENVNKKAVEQEVFDLITMNRYLLDYYSAGRN